MTLASGIKMTSSREKHGFVPQPWDTGSNRDWYQPYCLDTNCNYAMQELGCKWLQMFVDMQLQHQNFQEIPRNSYQFGMLYAMVSLDTSTLPWANRKRLALEDTINIVTSVFQFTLIAYHLVTPLRVPPSLTPCMNTPSSVAPFPTTSHYM